MVVKKAILSIEFAVIITVVIGAIAIMYNILSRHLQGRIIDTVDRLGGEVMPGPIYTPGTSYGVIQGRSHEVRRTRTFEYEGGRWEGSLSISRSEYTQNMHLKDNGKQKDLWGN